MHSPGLRRPLIAVSGIALQQSVALSRQASNERSQGATDVSMLVGIAFRSVVAPTSRLTPWSGPAGAASAHASPAPTALLPFPRATDRAVSPSCPNAPKMNRRSQGSAADGSPSWSPPVSRSQPRYAIRCCQIPPAI